MKLSKDLVKYAAKIAKASEEAVKTGQVYDWPMLLSQLPGSVLEKVPALSKLKEEPEKMDQTKKAELVSQVKALFSNGDICVDIALIILELIIVGIDCNINSVYTLLDEYISIKNPPVDYWFSRTDFEGSHQFNKDGIYLVNSIPRANDTTYYNSEIYNSPYTSISPKNVIINPFPVDNPVTERKKFIYDLLLNIPYVPSNGIVFSSRIKVKNLKGGSRGWGFWNTTVLPIGMKLAWFVQYDGKERDGIKPKFDNGFYAQTMNGGEPSTYRLKDLDEEWHDYRIELNENSVEYFIDGKSVYKVTEQKYIPDSPMAFHNWVDNAVFGIEKYLPHHILQETTAPRINYTQNMSIKSGGNHMMSTCPYYTKQSLLPQSQSPAQLSAWLSSNQTDYDLTSWCFFGNLISEDENRKVTHIDAVCSVVQFLKEQIIPGRPGLPLYGSCFAYNGEDTKEYLFSGTAGIDPAPAIKITSNPWSAVVTYGRGSTQSTISLSLVSGQMGVKGAIYMMAADVCDRQGRRLHAQIELMDRMGIVAQGYGPASFLPQWMTQRQHKVIKDTYSGSIQDYLDKTEDPMGCQGAYYYSAPMLDVLGFSITGDDNHVLAKGSRGTLWMDFVVQSFNPAAWVTVNNASWEFFAVQFPGIGTALMISSVTTIDPQSILMTANYFRKDSRTKPNGALVAEHEWNMNQINIEPDKESRWVSPQGVTYYMKYKIVLNSPDFTINLHIESVRHNQEIFFADTSKYEGVFKVRGTIANTPCEGFAWGELHGERKKK